MDYDTFVTRTLELANIGEREAVARAIQATLETLAEVLPRTRRDHVASELPCELRAHLNSRAFDRPLILEEFFARVAGRSGVRRSEGEARARTVLAVLREAISAGEWHHAMGSLHEDYVDLVGDSAHGIGR